MEGTIGTILKAQREALGLSIEEVAESTSFRAEQIASLEKDDFSCFKTVAYAKGAIRGYGNFLGLNGLELVDYFKANQMDQAVYGGNVDSGSLDSVSKSKLNMNLVSEQGVGTQTNFNKDSNPLPFRQIAVGVILALVIIGGCFFIPGLKFDRADLNFVQEIKTKVTGIYDTFTNLVSETRMEEEKKKTFVKQPVVQDKKSDGINQNLQADMDAKNKKVAGNYSAPAAVVPAKKVDKNAIAARYDKVVVEMTASGQCWIDVFADGKAIYSGMMNNGRYKIFEADKRLTVRYGNIGVMQVIVNGKPVNMRGEAGVATRHYPK